MIDYSIQNKKAWEYNAYEFWVKQSGAPVDRAKRDLENPIGMLKRYSDYFDTYSGITIANICGSCGKKAVPLAILGAEVINCGFTLRKFDEHPAWTNEKIPGEFTIMATKPLMR